MGELVTWKWLGDSLVEDVGRRNVIVTSRSLRDVDGEVRGELMTCGDGGILEPLTPDHPIAERIRAVPETEAQRNGLLEFARAVVDRADTYGPEHSESGEGTMISEGLVTLARRLIASATKKKP